jgi:hypothetical protein
LWYTWIRRKDCKKVVRGYSELDYGRRIEKIYFDKYMKNMERW